MFKVQMVIDEYFVDPECRFGTENDEDEHEDIISLVLNDLFVNYCLFILLQ